MTILGVQLILIFFGLFMIYISFLYWKRGSFSNLSFGSWLFIWSGFLVFSLFPKVLEPLLKELFFVRAMDFGMIVAFMILTYLTIINNIKMKKYETDFEELVRKTAIKQVKIKK